MPNSSIAVIADFESPRDGIGDLPAFATKYITEILGHAGVPFDLLDPDAIPSDIDGYTVALIPRNSKFTLDQNMALVKFVDDGGTVIGTAGTCELDGLFGVETLGPITEGYIKPPKSSNPITAAITREVHVFGGSRVRADYGNSLSFLEVDDGSVFDGVIENRHGRGRAILFAFDLVTTIAHLQMGHPLVPVPPREAINASAGTVLDKDRDRDRIEIKDHDDLYYPTTNRGPDGLVEYNQELYLHPMADDIKGMLLRAIFHAHTKAQKELPVLWYWPRGKQSIAHMSHDSDGQRVSQAWSLYHILDELGIQTTWCTMPVDGWTREFFDTLKNYGHEIALHYAFGRSPSRTDHRWSQTDFNWQVDWLCYMAQVPRIISNKNHGLGMKGRLEFYQWCEAKGIQVDQSHGDFGFTFGTSHPFFPMDDGKPQGSYIDVLALPFLTQDAAVTGPIAFINPLADKCHEAYGVAHYLYHPSHSEDPGNERAIRETVAYTRSLDMEWWKSDDIGAWERARRDLTLTKTSQNSTYEIKSGKPLKDATVLFLETNGATNGQVVVDDDPLDTITVERYGHKFKQVISNLDGDHEVLSSKETN